MKQPAPLSLLFALTASILFLFFCTPAHASPERRVALVIGNGAYEHVPRLRNPSNDAADVAGRLESLGFDVTRRTDLGQQGLRQALQQFARSASGADMAVLFYAGHGMEVDGLNWLVPVDARMQSDVDVEFEAVGLELALRSVSGARHLGLVILDACRDNPFAKALQRGGARSVGRGLGRIEPHGGILVAYAARDGTVALDGDGQRNSPYTTALLEVLDQPGLEVGLLFRHVRDRVLASTNSRQEPFTYGSLPGMDIFLHPPVPGQTGQASPPVQPQQTPPVSSEALELAFWESIKDSQNPADYEAYLSRFPGGTFAALAGNRLAALRPAPAQTPASQPPTATPAPEPHQQVAMAPRPTPPSGPKAGEVRKEPHTGMEFVWVPAGCFQMGCGSWTSECWDDEKPVHEVCVDGFWMGKYEVTQAQWQKVMGGNPSHFKGPNNPVENVSWNDAQEFLKKLNSQSSASGLRLPTEAEWEYACRGGGRQEKYCGGDNVDSVAWYDNNSGRNTHPVGGKSPNALGIYDMSGNVWEWVSDWYGSGYYAQSPQRNPQGPSSGSNRVIRGGSWGSYDWDCRAAYRNSNTPGYRFYYLGFRVALSPGQQ